ncbi:hypothetical protein GCM10027082_48070 [Comamonas humi]
MDAIRRIQRQRLGNQATGRMADYVRTLDAQLIQQCHHLPGNGINGLRPLCRGAAHPRVVDGKRPKVACPLQLGRPPEPAQATQSWDKHHGRTVAAVGDAKR